ncbi:unnamed protein product, partial [Discosporangium mesarthrocarpum]
KSRIHSYRGARYVEISLDGKSVFRGEIRRAPGGVADIESSSECILFTTNEAILQIIEKYDRCLHPTLHISRGDTPPSPRPGAGHDRGIVVNTWTYGGNNLQRPSTACGDHDRASSSGRSSGSGGSGDGGGGSRAGVAKAPFDNLRRGIHDE